MKNGSLSAGLTILFNLNQTTTDRNVECLARENDNKAKITMKDYADKKLKTKPHNFHIDKFIILSLNYCCKKFVFVFCIYFYYNE
jgi:hypothetical protein